MMDEERLAAAFVDLTDTLVADYDVADLLYRLVDHSLDLLGADQAGLMLSDQRGNLQVMASSDERTQALELFQLQSDQGPCLDCYHSSEPVHVPNLSEYTARWPRFTQTATDRGYTAVHAVPLRTRDQTIGALNLFSTDSQALPESSRRVARALADVASIAILHERASQRRELVIEQLEGALTSRIIIEQAKGSLAASGNLTPDQAFSQIRNYTRATNASLTNTARDIVEQRLQPDTILGNQQTTS